MPYKDKEKQRIAHAEYQKRRYHEKRSEFVKFLGSVCVICGTCEELEIHHKDPNTKSFEIGELWDCPWNIIEPELKKCELRCKKHHKSIHEAKHGTPSRYRHHRCRCDLCRLAWNKDSAARKRIWRANQKLKLMAG